MKITYTDKTSLNTDPSIPVTNKVTDDDMNEIKNVVNSNDTSLDKVKGTILWTNSSPSSNFASQTITLSSDDYDMLMFVIKRQNNYDTLVPPLILPKGFEGVGLSQSLSGENRRRNFTYIDDTHYSIGNGTTPSGNTDNGAVIPLYVIGYKTGLF